MTRKKKIDLDMPTFSIPKHEKQRMVEEVLSQFDFEKVHKVMALLNWQYYIDESVPDRLISIPVSTKSIYSGVPSPEYLKQFARDLMMDVLNSRRFDTIHCGGFTVFFDARYGELKLDFSVETYTTYPRNDP